MEFGQPGGVTLCVPLVSDHIIRRSGFSGHALFGEADPEKVLAYTGSLPNLMNDTLLVHVTGSMTKAERALRTRPITVSRTAVAELIAWKKQNDPSYRSARVDSNALAALIRIPTQSAHSHPRDFSRDALSTASLTMEMGLHPTLLRCEVVNSDLQATRGCLGNGSKPMSAPLPRRPICPPQW